MDSKTTPLPPSAGDTIASEAASWIAQLDSGKMTDADRMALREWAARSPRARAELKALGDMWHDIDRLLGDALPSDRTVQLGSVVAAGLRTRPAPFYAALAACVAVSLAVLFGLNTLPETAMPQSVAFEATYTVDAGDSDIIDLPDGSVVHMNTDTLLEVAIDSQSRSLRLLRGEAHFDVASDASRPFVVRAGGSTVRALGTSFTVRLNAKDTSVFVVEGVVELSGAPTLSGDAPATSPVPAGQAVLRAGQCGMYRHDQDTPELIVQKLSAEQLRSRLAWRDGLLVFEGEPLQRVADEISRYTSAKVIIADPQLRDVVVGGVFPSDQPEALLRALDTTFDIRVERVDDGTIYLHSKSPSR